MRTWSRIRVLRGSSEALARKTHGWGRVCYAVAPLLCVLLAPAHADITLAPGPAFSLNHEPTYIATADFDRDGLADVATLKPGTNSISILFGDEARTLNGVRQVNVGDRLDRFTVGDANGDGIPDLVAVSNADDSLYVARGSGTGTFQVAARFDVGRRPIDVALGNFDGARGNDLVVVAQDDDEIRVLLNRGGNIGFQSTGDLAVGNRPKRVGTGDLNGDGLDDIVVLNTGTPNDDDVSIFLNPGNGRFARQSRYGVGPRAKDIAITDANNDGALDILVLNGKPVAGRANTFTVSVLLNQTETRASRIVGSGTFESAPDVAASCPSTIGGIPVFCDPKRLAAADFDGDGFVDFSISFSTLAKVGSLFTPGVLTALAGFGDGSFGPGAQADIGARPFGLAATDFNGDHISDLAVAEEGTSSVRIVIGLPPAQRPPGLPCTSGLQCNTGFCTDAVCCTTATCPSGEFCNYAETGGVCSREPTPSPTGTETATPTPTPTRPGAGATCAVGDSLACAPGLFCTDGRCCTTATCPAHQRCDITGSRGQCHLQLQAGEACETATDCASGLLCAPGDQAGSICVVAPTATPPPTATETPSPLPTRTAGQICTGDDCDCPGDCSGDGAVTVDELLTLVAISLGDSEVAVCLAGDLGGDGSITVDDILAATNSLLNGCPPAGN